MSTDAIYLDHNATTPLDPRVFAAMEPYLRGEFGNAASHHHGFGQRAAAAVDAARESVAGALGADPREIYWTSGATESNNLALLGIARSQAYISRRHVVTLRTEHPAVLDPCRELQRQGYEVEFLPVASDGTVSMERLASAIRADTLVVSVMHANNETGVLQDIEAIGALCRERGVLFHTDAVQSFGKEPLDVERACVDLLSFSGHKLYGPKGAGGLYVRRKGPRVRCEPLLLGGGQERGLRSGTLNVPGIVGLASAVEIAVAARQEEQVRIRSLRDAFEAELAAVCDGVDFHCSAAARLANTSNFSRPDWDAESWMAATPGIAVSTASACASASRQPSYVLGALGIGADRIRGSVRVSLGRGTTAADVASLVRELAAS